MLKPIVLSILLTLTLNVSASSPYPRSEKMKRAFMDIELCPSTGTFTRKCKGYHVDHVKPLCAGGQDMPNNMQYLSIAAHKAKTKKDLRFCAYLRHIK